MTSGLEFEGKNIENAIKKACEKLKVKEEKLKYDVISYGSTGIFGLVGTKKAKIRVTSPRQLKTRKHENNSSNIKSPNILEEQDKIEISAIIEESFGENNLPVKNNHEIGGIVSESNEKVEVSPENAQDNLQNTAHALIAGEEVLQKIIDLITTDAGIETRLEKNKIKYHVNGGNSAVLIGKKGQTLEAIQYIVEKIVNKTSQQKVMVHVDVENYLENRRLNLEKLSAKLAEKAKRVGRPVTIGQMNAHDRRVVHLLLKDDSGVRTQSIGNGFYRKLVIFPKKNKK